MTIRHEQLESDQARHIQTDPIARVCKGCDNEVQDLEDYCEGCKNEMRIDDDES